EHARELLAAIVQCGPLSSGEGECAVLVLETAEADEFDRPRCPATAGILCGYQHVQIGQRTVAHVIDKRDVLALVLDVAPGAVEEHFECRQSVEWRRLLRVRTYGQAQNQDSHKAERELLSRTLKLANNIVRVRSGSLICCVKTSVLPAWPQGCLRPSETLMACCATFSVSFPKTVSASPGAADPDLRACRRPVRTRADVI